MHPFARFVLAVQSLLAAAQILVGASNLSDVMSPTAAGWVVLVVTAGQAAVVVLSRSKGLTVALVVQASLAAGQAAVAAGSLADLVPHTAAVWFGLLVAMAQAAAAAWASGVVTPTPLSNVQFLRGRLL